MGLSRITTILAFCLCLALTNADLCDICECNAGPQSESSGDQVLVIKCNGQRRNKKIEKINIENLQWPDTDDKWIHAHFNNLKLLVLPKLPGNPNVVSLNFDDNEIRSHASEPFHYFNNLKMLSLANNRLTSLTTDFLRMKMKLTHLNLANNSLSEIDSEVLQQMNELQVLNLSQNEFVKVTKTFLETLHAIGEVNLSDNKIFNLEQPDAAISWNMLDLSDNEMTLVASTTFKNFEKLEKLDLSHNKLANVDNAAFVELKSLTHLSLAGNFLRDLALELPQSMEVLSANGNQLKLWPLMGAPSHLRELYLQTNQLAEMYQIEDKFERLQILNISSNNIDILPPNELPALKTLDLSFNHLTAVPQGLQTRTPMLETLILDNNDIENIVFHEVTPLAMLSISNMPKLTVLEDETFSNIAGLKIRQDGTGLCVDIKVSHCPLLAHIKDRAFAGVDLCHLDLSYNQLTNLPQHLTNWSRIEDGMNFQGNPFDCSCTNQWMLDVILKTLYERKEHQYLLKDLTCGGPEPFNRTRFVKYYRRPKAFCNPSSALRMLPQTFAGYGDGEEPEFAYGRGPGITTIIVCSVVVLLALIGVGLYLTIEQRRRLARRNRRY